MLKSSRKNGNKPQVFALSLSPDIPSRPGVYKIQNSAGTLIYVGGTNNLRKRYTSHLRRLIKKIHPNNRLQKMFNSNKTVVFFKILKICSKESIARLEQKYLDVSFKTVTKLNKQTKAGSGH